MVTWCKCGNHGPQDYYEAVKSGACDQCWLQRWHPDKVPPLRQEKATDAATAQPRGTRYRKCPKCGTQMTKLVSCSSCKGSVLVKTCGVCNP